MSIRIREEFSGDYFDGVDPRHQHVIVGITVCGGAPQIDIRFTEADRTVFIKNCSSDFRNFCRAYLAATGDGVVPRPVTA